MYSPPTFRNDDTAEQLDFVAARGFGLAVASGEDVPFGVHVPLVVDRDKGELGAVRFHVARANPFHEMVAARPKILLAVPGPDAYVSPDWYSAPQQVPTWNYVAVHLTGPARILDTDELTQVLVDLSAIYEARLAPKPPWKLDKLSDKVRDGLLRAIVGLEMTIEATHGKWKLSQNKSGADYQGVVEALGASSDPGAQAIAGFMGAGRGR
jgi:transcriptional regulator